MGRRMSGLSARAHKFPVRSWTVQATRIRIAVWVHGSSNQHIAVFKPSFCLDTWNVTLGFRCSNCARRVSIVGTEGLRLFGKGQNRQIFDIKLS